MEKGMCCIQCGKKLDESIYINNNQITTNNTVYKFQNYGNNNCQNSEINIIETSSTNQTESSHDKSSNSSIICNSNNNTALLKQNTNEYGKVQVQNSKNVIIGNVTYITGPVHITEVVTHIEEENITNQLYMNESDTTILNIIPRENWMAREPGPLTPLPGPVKYVIIAHTATEDGYTEPQNALLTKIIQNFHMDSRKWDDIAYNFLIGCDGNIYKGRGWNIQGAHTFGYNQKSMCIAFIGCFMDHLPPISSLKAATKLISEGVKLGFIPEDYSLVGHCQCIPIESPGVQLFNEIKKWPRWRELTPADSKS